MNALDDTGRDAHGGGSLRPLYPKSIAYLIEERHLLWYEDPEEYDNLRQEVFAELKPEGALNCIFVKNVVDCMWEFRRMGKMKHSAINYAMPEAAGRVIAPGIDFQSDREEAHVRRLAAAVAYGAEEPTAGGGVDLASRMKAKGITPEMIHYKTLDSLAERLQWISRECERLESRLHRLIRDYEARNARLAAMAKSVVERERAEVVEFREVN